MPPTRREVALPLWLEQLEAAGLGRRPAPLPRSPQDARRPVASELPRLQVRRPGLRPASESCRGAEVAGAGDGEDGGRADPASGGADSTGRPATAARVGREGAGTQAPGVEWH